jgi:hypothetical protein
MRKLYRKLAYAERLHVPHLNGENNNNKHRVIHVRHKIVGEMRIDIYIYV